MFSEDNVTLKQRHRKHMDIYLRVRDRNHVHES